MIAIALLVVFLASIYLLMKKFNEKTQYFDMHNIKYVKPLPLVGNDIENFLGKKHQSEIIEECYKALPNEDLFGYFGLAVPQIIIRNAALVEKIFVKDFSHFTDRVKPPGPVKTASEATLFNLCGIQWRATRNKFSPLFTSTKLKYMYESLGLCGKHLEEHLDDCSGRVVDMTDVMSRYTLDVIGSIAYGLDISSLKNPNTNFKHMAYRINETSLLTQLKFVFILAVPRILRLFGISGGFIQDKTSNYFIDIIRDALEQRKKTKIERPDFIQLMLTLKEKGKLEMQREDSVDDYLVIDKSIDGQAVELTDEILIGGGFSFIFAGFHSSAMTMSYTLFEMARNPHVLQKAKSEIEEVCHKGVTYDNLKNLKYLENVIKETLRFYPTATLLFRVCTKEYTMPNGFVIKPETIIVVPVSALHKDPNYFDDPLVFDPDRFESNPVPGSFLPFGDGPRICIGMRLAMMEMKYCLAKLLLRYKIELVDKPEPGPLKMVARTFLTTPNSPIKMKITKI